jgi:hypothetical protein
MEEEGKLRVKSWDASSTDVLGTERVPNIYTNNVQIGFSNWDAWLQLGEIMGEREGRLLIAPKARVVMSLEHAKAFLKALQDSLRQFEENFGEIQLFDQKALESERKAAEVEAKLKP